MSQTLQINDQSFSSQIMAINLNVYTGTDIVTKETPEEAIQLLEVHPSIDLIIIGPQESYEKTLDAISTYLEINKRIIPIIAVHHVQKAGQESTPIKEIVQAAAKILGVTAKDMYSKEVGEYFPIPIGCFFAIDTTEFPIYLLLQDERVHGDYVCQFKAGDRIPNHILTKFIQYGVKSLFVRAEDRTKFTDDLTKKLITDLQEDLPEPERVQRAQAAIEVVSDSVRAIGLTPATQALIQSSIQSIEKSIKKNKELTKSFKNLISQKEGYLYSHCHILTCICHHIIEQMDWGQEEHMLKLGFASFFHDIFLETPEMVKIRTKKDLENSSFSGQEKKLIEEHAFLAANAVTKMTGSAADTYTIILQHHGSTNGRGFPENYSDKLAPLSMTFIVAEAFTDLVIKKNAELTQVGLKLIIEELEDTFSVGKYKKILDALKNLEI